MTVPPSATPTVVVTKIGGTIDFITANGSVDVVVVDLDAQLFPDDAETMIARLRDLPRNTPWRDDLIGQLLKRQLVAR